MSEPEEIGRWWQTGIIYQIYPLSFQDSNGDGIGDLPGVLRRLDYLAGLGVTVLWLSPVFPSPMRDCGYDIANYCEIHRGFGTLADFDRLLHEIHARGMRLLLGVPASPGRVAELGPGQSRPASARDPRGSAATPHRADAPADPQGGRRPVFTAMNSGWKMCRFRWRG